jgi:ATP-binding cassette subfamily B (MDR/TAP) protein 1
LCLVKNQGLTWTIDISGCRVPAIDEDAPGDTPDAVEGHIELRNMSFSYPARPDVTVFSNFSLDVPAATVIALVGQSGSGKSTVVQLVERFYDPDNGQVTLLLPQNVPCILCNGRAGTGLGI